MPFALNIKTIIKKELKDYFDGPAGYLILLVFVLFWEFLFFRSYFIIGQASLRPMFEMLPWLFMIFIPAITMRSVSREKEEGTLEWILTHPVNEFEFVLSKFLAAIIFILVSLMLTLLVPFFSAFFGRFDIGILAGQYIGSILLGFVFVSLGVFVSSLFKSSVTSLLVSVVCCFFLVISGSELITASIPIGAAHIIERLSVISHFTSLSRGVIDLRDVLYFLSVSAVFLSLTYLSLIKNKLGNHANYYRNYKIGVGLLILITILIGITGSRIPGRIDLTEDGRYTLSEGTKKLLNSLNDIVNITVFSSERLPAQLGPLQRDVKDTLRDYQTLGKGNIIVTYKDPDSDPAARNEAAMLGIRQAQFNLIGQEEFQLKTGYLGLVVSYGDRHETIPFIRTSADLEYQLTSFISKLTVKEKKKVAFLSGHGEKSIFSDLSGFKKELDSQFTVSELELNKEDKDKKPLLGYNVLVIAGPSKEIDKKIEERILEYLGNGGSILFMADKVSIDMNSLMVKKNENSFSEFLNQFGLDINDDIVYDLRSHESVSFGGGNFRYIVPYPFWIRALKPKEISPLSSGIEAVLFPWASSISLKKEKDGITVHKIFVTSKAGGVQAEHFNIAPNQGFEPSGELNKRILSVALLGKSINNSSTNKPWRMVVTGDSDFLTDNFVKNSPENLAFGLNAVEWLAEEPYLADVKIKNLNIRRLLFRDPAQIMLLKFGTYILTLLIVFFAGLFHLLKRRRLTLKGYQI